MGDKIGLFILVTCVFDYRSLKKTFIFPHCPMNSYNEVNSQRIATLQKETLAELSNIQVVLT